MSFVKYDSLYLHNWKISVSLWNLKADFLWIISIYKASPILRVKCWAKSQKAILILAMPEHYCEWSKAYHEQVPSSTPQGC